MSDRQTALDLKPEKDSDMAKRYYSLLTLRMFFTAVPAFPSKLLKKIIEYLYTEDEARVAFCLPLYPRSASYISIMARLPFDWTEAMLEEMTAKGLVVSLKKNGRNIYTLPPLFPGLYELTFLKGEEGEWARSLMVLYEEYFERFWRKVYFPLGVIPKHKALRTIPVGKALPDGSKRTSLEEARRIVEVNNQFYVGTCFCRHGKHLQGEGCDAPRETCLLIGEWPARLFEKGMVKRYTKEQAYDLLERCDEAGLLRITDTSTHR